MTQITVLIPDGESSREIVFTATRWEETPGPDAGMPPDPAAGRLDLFAGTKPVAWFSFGAWMGVWFTDRKKVPDDRRF